MGSKISSSTDSEHSHTTISRLLALRAYTKADKT
jgi:hypothetical protein